MEARAVVAALLHELGVPDTALSLLVAHAAAVARAADRLGLVGERTLDGVLLRHTADALLLALAREPRPSEQWVDVGSGAGFPGLVLACAFGRSEFLFSEPQQRRAAFLELQALTLGLTHVRITRERLEALPAAYADVVVVRALERWPSLLSALHRLLRADGMLLIAAGPRVAAPEGAQEVRVTRPHVDSPGRVLMMRAAHER